ncbi:MAG: TonB-dependent receptor [Gammaproteobacteria bacterium]|nr:TonB-dependent receptor [Gammaproteobacteria bacterium]
MRDPLWPNDGLLIPLLCATFGLALAPKVLAAEEETAAPETPAIEEVVVTARRVVENLQAVPIAITAVGNSDVRQLDIRSVTDLQRIVPSLTATGRLGQNEESLTLRGQRATGEFIGAGAGPAVVSYFAEVPSATTGPGLYLDMASVQVLKGPQGTLFGRNTTGGAVLYEPNRPLNVLSGYVQATGGSFGRRDVEGVLNAPLIDGLLAVRFAGQRQERDGLAVDVNTGTEYNNRDNETIRLGVQFNPGERFSNYFVFQSVEFEENGPASVLFALNPAGPLFPFMAAHFDAQRSRGSRRVALGVDGLETRDTDIVLNRTEIDIGDATLTNIVSYTRERGNRSGDLDGTVLAISDSLGVTGHGDGANPDHSILTEELQVSGNALDGRLDWRIGGYMERLRTEGAQTFSQRLFLGQTTHQLDAPQSVDSEAVFGHVNVELGSVSDSLEDFDLSAGYRYTRDANSIGFDLLVYPGQLLQVDEIPPPMPGDFCFTGAVYPNCFVEVDGSDSGRSWNLGVDYRPAEDLLVYASYRRGYKSGGFNPAIGVFFGKDVSEYAFGPEEVDAIELGIKSNWSHANLSGRTNVAVYKSWYNEVQVLNNVVIGVAATTATQNAAEATIAGFEIEGEIRPLEHVGLTYGYAHTNADYVTYITPAGEDLSGLPFLYTPRRTYNLGVALDFVLPDDAGTLTVFAHHSWQDEMFAGFTTPDVPGVTIPAYGLTNMRVEWNGLFGSGADLALFVNNASDEEYRIANNPHYESLGFAITQYGEPKSWGASIRFDF